MRVQHNIVAMNSYRNYNNNTRSINKNLEKLSSGYRINRAGDDAAGLAISEKMRAQITGLEGAQKNAKDGISLVQTAEGALTEVHSMLNRMVELAEQSANGTYNNTTDRAQLQKEVDALKDEINRIADSANFNGIKLLDGSLGGGATKGVAVSFDYPNAALTTGLVTMQGATETTIDFSFINTGAAKLDDETDYKLNIVYADKDGVQQSKTIDFKPSDEYTAGTAGSELADDIKTKLSDIFKDDDFEIEVDGSDVTITAKTAGAANKAAIYSMEFTEADTGEVVAVFKGGSTAATAVSGADAQFTNTAGEDAYYKLDTSTMKNGDDHNGTVFKVNGQSFAFVTADKVKDLSTSNYIVVEQTEDDWPATTGVTAADAERMAELINKKTGINATVDGTTISLQASKGTAATGGGTSLQIGDTAESWNQLEVNIDDIHSATIGVGGVDISSQDGAKVALNQINDAINYVSNVRGGLGAIQNRLEHTINNLSVMKENMQDAESTIRDTDVADEMMKYTKNSILVQSAQAMLAQANQQPQGVLQLLQ